MDPRLRIAILLGGLFFCLLFASLTIAVAVQYGFDIFTLVSLAILGLIATGLAGAIRHPDD